MSEVSVAGALVGPRGIARSIRLPLSSGTLVRAAGALATAGGLFALMAVSHHGRREAPAESGNIVQSGSAVAANVGKADRAADEPAGVPLVFAKAFGEEERLLNGVATTIERRDPAAEWAPEGGVPLLLLANRMPAANTAENVAASSSHNQTALAVPLPPTQPPTRKVHPTRQVATAAPAEPAPQAQTQIGKTAAPAPAPSGQFNLFAKLFGQTDNTANKLLATNPQTAVYDIKDHTVYLPTGEKLEAHSGLGGFLDDPASKTRKSRGVTPPNVYKVSLREKLFHGVQALRLTPVDQTSMYGRDGILAHSYMLGPNGQSNGCVSFKNYPRFLEAFLDGRVKQLIVVPDMQSPPPAQIANADPGTS